jgi:hypothetical protein
MYKFESKIIINSDLFPIYFNLLYQQIKTNLMIFIELNQP